MTTKYLHGSMVPRRATRNVDHRGEPRIEVQSETAVLVFRGRNYATRLANRSSSGAMVIFSLIPYIGETISIQLVGLDPVPGRVCWVRDGKIGITFVAPVE